ncbi:hypothetical protein GB937_005600 [Aspergillus fischeri]|nr:hypothetical protein GB937_005600 [Aspergillus fischeri]
MYLVRNRFFNVSFCPALDLTNTNPPKANIFSRLTELGLPEGYLGPHDSFRKPASSESIAHENQLKDGYIMQLDSFADWFLRGQ